jgi:hypothetical protein
MGKSTAQAMNFEDVQPSAKPHKHVAIKEIERTIDNFNFGRLSWYIVKRYRFQLSILVNAYFLGAPAVRFVSQFFN